VEDAKGTPCSAQPSGLRRCAFPPSRFGLTGEDAGRREGIEETRQGGGIRDSFSPASVSHLKWQSRRKLFLGKFRKCD
jgi:hypothetical protein